MPEIVMAERISGSGAWAGSVVERLLKRAYSVKAIQSGEELLRLLTVGSPLDLVIAGRDLRGLSALDAVCMAEKMHREAGRKRNEWPVRGLLAVTDVTTDVELLELLRRRGITGFLNPSSDLEKTVDYIAHHLYTALRAEPRVPVRLAGRLVRGGESRGGDPTPGEVTDLSRSGARFEVAARGMEGAVNLGEEVTVRFLAPGRTRRRSPEDPETASNVYVECRAEVRQIQLQKQWLRGKRLTYGLRFLEPDVIAAATIDQILSDAANVPLFP